MTANIKIIANYVPKGSKILVDNQELKEGEETILVIQYQLWKLMIRQIQTKRTNMMNNILT